MSNDNITLAGATTKTPFQVVQAVIHLLLWNNNHQLRFCQPEWGGDYLVNTAVQFGGASLGGNAGDDVSSLAARLIPRWWWYQRRQRT